MTPEEALYWKNYIDRVISEKLYLDEVSEKDARRISEFAKKYMQTITGQQFLPQGIFREFLELFASIPQLQEQLIEIVLNITAPAYDKEVVNVRTYSKDAPDSPEEEDLYISANGTGALFVYTDGEWVNEQPSEDVIYITADTSRIYVYNGAEFVDVTGESYNNIIFVSNTTTDLEKYTDVGVYNVCKINGRNTEWFTLTIAAKRGRSLLGRPVLVTIYQTLRNDKGFQIRSKVDSSEFSKWEVSTYAIKEEVMPLVYAGL